MPTKYNLSHALFYNDNEAAKPFKPSSDFTSVEVDDNGDADGGLNAFLATRVAAIGAATAQAAVGAGGHPTAVQPASVVQPAPGGQHAGVTHEDAFAAMAGPETTAPSAPASTWSPSAQGQSGLFVFEGGGAMGAAGAGSEASAGTGPLRPSRRLRGGDLSRRSTSRFAQTRAVPREQGSLSAGASAQASALTSRASQQPGPGGPSGGDS